jgi:hypothetical protein
MKNRICQTPSLIIIGIVMFTLCISQAQTYTWADNAQGQQYQHCPLLNPQYWPSNSAWSQSLVFSPNCDNTTNVVSQPSNWTPSPPTGVYPGGPGAVGVDVVLGPPANTIADDSGPSTSIA